MAEGVKCPALPANYVSIAVLRERWLQRQQQEEMKCEEGDKGNDGVLGKGKDKVMEDDDVDVDVGGVEIKGEVLDMGVSRGKGGFKYGGRRMFRRASWVRKRNVREEENVEVLEGSIGLGKRRVNEEVEDKIGGKFRGLLRYGGVRKGNVEYGGVRKGNVEYGGVRKDNVEYGGDPRGVRKDNVEHGGDRRGVRKGNVEYGGDRRRFGKVSGVWKGKNVVEKQNVVDMGEESEAVKGNLVDGKMLEVSKGYGGYRRINETVDIGRKFGDLTINGGGRKGTFRYEVGKPIPVAVRKQNEVEEQIPVTVRKQNEVEKQIPVAVRDENEVEKQILVTVRKQNDVEKQIPVAVRDENEVEKQNLVDVKMSETSKGFGHRRGKESIGGKFGALPKNAWRKGSVKYGRDRGRFGSRRYKRKESGMIWAKKCDAESGMTWVKKCDAETDKQAPVQTADVN